MSVSKITHKVVNEFQGKSLDCLRLLKHFFVIIDKCFLVTNYKPMVVFTALSCVAVQCAYVGTRHATNKY